MRSISTLFLFCLLSGTMLHAATGLKTATAPIQELPSLNAAFSIGFNYDLLNTPTEVPYDYSRGYFGLNIPFQQNIEALDIARGSAPVVDSIFSDTTVMRGGDRYKPKASAKQNPNTTVRVDVPMMGGTATFSNTQNVSLSYSNTIGNPDLFFVPESLQAGLSMVVRGTMNVPIDLSMTWESMTLGYAMRVNKYFSFAGNLHRHLFVFDMNGSLSADILGNFHYDPSAGQGGSAVSGAVIDQRLEYDAQKVHGKVQGHYEAEAWSPTIGIQAWRFTVTGRLGIDVLGKGELDAAYSTPFFINPETGKMLDFQNTQVVLDNLNKFTANATDSMRYYTKQDLHWTMPHALTIGFDIIPHNLTFSYTKLFGEVGLLLPGIRTVRGTVGEIDSLTPSDTVSLDVGVKVDHVIMLSGNWQYLYFNLGVFTLDVRTRDRTNLIGNNLPANLSWAKLDGSPMLPVLNAGSAIGTRMQLVLELDVLPFPAVKAGIRYHF